MNILQKCFNKNLKLIFFEILEFYNMAKFQISGQ